MALLLLQRYPHISYTIVDVPPASEVSKKFLQGKFNVREIAPPDLAKEKDIDVFYTSSVLSELDMEKVRYYFSCIGKSGRYFYLKDWKKGHHLNDLPFLYGFFLRLVNKMSVLVFGKPSSWARARIDSYRISEQTYPKLGWQELLRWDCEAVTGYSPSKHPQGGESGFFEVVYKIR